MNEKEKNVLIFLTVVFIVGSILSILNQKRKKKEFFNFQKEVAIKENYLIDINKASKEELVTLPGIGEVIAQRIIQYREKYGKFKNKLELLKIKGIGKKRLSIIESLIEIK